MLALFGEIAQFVVGGVNKFMSPGGEVFDAQRNDFCLPLGIELTYLVLALCAVVGGDVNAPLLCYFQERESINKVLDVALRGAVDHLLSVPGQNEHPL